MYNDTKRLARQVKQLCNSKICDKSSKRFCNEITEERLSHFERFWSDMDWEHRKVFVSSLADFQTSQRSRTEAELSKRSATLTYHLKIGGVRKQVCKKTF